MLKHFTMTTWPSGISEVLQAQGVTDPTPIQAKMIPEALAKKNILARSQTGTGKTLAYVLPILAHIQIDKKAVQAIVIAPSQELALQIMEVVRTLTQNGPITSAAFIGGTNINRQVDKLKKQKPHIVIGTPGRVLELIEMKKLKLTDVAMVALDEVDRMVDEAVSWRTVEMLGKRIGRTAQFLCVSATVQADVAKQLLAWLPEVHEIKVDGGLLPDTLAHIVIQTTARERIDVTRKVIHAESIKKGLVFVNQIDQLNEVTAKLRYHGISAVALSSEGDKHERSKAIRAFEQGEAAILVATDVAARGLDIAHITHIIQVYAPNTVESYIHRAGRTGRFNAPGKVITLLEAREAYKVQKYEATLGTIFSEGTLRHGQLKISK
ncbi:DEAD/DEAH box helicase [Shouchella lonarensis]|uniref:Helicase conserved C-terminal domain-containing protein n=1 Tax=Shouchella lonarensis TaxID=1464122 RepID=A0A1G6H2I8_9BACI|nr:DEAD/DEAH box helicase [Shouchella lonarensis]SDB88499.1 Helicase conserved C-terminal domain-containing protein [Shouchella lonarensis]